ncbi:MAG: response regulator [Chloroflexi bacterium]|nr:response regulator [Chloroflexota bacterium]
MRDSSHLHSEQKILVVDDNDYTVVILRHVLSRAGYQIMSASSGEEALDLVRKDGLPDLAIVDYHMYPGMSGSEFCRAVHQLADLPIIMVTAVPDESLVHAGLDNHVVDVIYKPFSPPALVARVGEVLECQGKLSAPPFAPAAIARPRPTNHQSSYVSQ